MALTFESRESVKVMKVLVAVDGSPCSDAAIAEIAQRPWPAGSEIEVLSVYEPPVVPATEVWATPPDYFEKITQALVSTASKIVDSAMARLKEKLAPPLTITGGVVQGWPKTAILDEAEKWNADLIVVGSHGYGAWGRFLLGSVSQAVMAHAKCSVEVVRNREGLKE